MKKPIQFDVEARSEFDTAIDFIDAARPGHGDLFESMVQDAMDSIAAQPRMHAANRKGVRKALIKTFHYNIIYREETDHIRIISVFHTSRNPRVWQKRV